MTSNFLLRLEIEILVNNSGNKRKDSKIYIGFITQFAGRAFYRLFDRFAPQ